MLHSTTPWSRICSYIQYVETVLTEILNFLRSVYLFFYCMISMNDRSTFISYTSINYHKWIFTYSFFWLLGVSNPCDFGISSRLYRDSIFTLLRAHPDFIWSYPAVHLQYIFSSSTDKKDLIFSTTSKRCNLSWTFS